MYKLNTQSKSFIKDIVGSSFESILMMDSSEIDAQIEKKINKKLKHNRSSSLHLNGRGTPFLYFWRLVNLEVIDKLLSKI